jgi:MFS transporter, putative metabolite:H+ symporter
MQDNTAEDLLAFFDNAPLNSRYWITFAVMSAVVMFDFFDFLVVGYLLAAVAREWHLSYGQSAVILYSGGIGAIVGAMLFGGLADAWGRKQQVVVGTVICGLTSGLIAVCPPVRGFYLQHCVFLSASALAPHWLHRSRLSSN